MLNNALGLNGDLGALSGLNVVLTNTDLDTRGSFPVDAMSGGNDPSAVHDGSSTSWSSVEQHENLPWPRPSLCCRSTDHTAAGGTQHLYVMRL